VKVVRGLPSSVNCRNSTLSTFRRTSCHKSLQIISPTRPLKRENPKSNLTRQSTTNNFLKPSGKNKFIDISFEKGENLKSLQNQRKREQEA